MGSEMCIRDRFSCQFQPFNIENGNVSNIYIIKVSITKIAYQLLLLSVYHKPMSFSSHSVQIDLFKGDFIVISSTSQSKNKAL